MATPDPNTSTRIDAELPLSKPDITVAQIVTLVGAVIAVAVAFGFDMTDEQKFAVLGLASVIGGFFLHSDAKIRQGRSSIEAARANAGANTSVDVPSNPPA